MVPLPTQAVALLRELHRATGHGKFVFPRLRTEHECMSENTINAALRAMGFSKEVMTAHGSACDLLGTHYHFFLECIDVALQAMM